MANAEKAEAARVRRMVARRGEDRHMSSCMSWCFHESWYNAVWLWFLAAAAAAAAAAALKPSVAACFAESVASALAQPLAALRVAQHCHLLYSNLMCFHWLLLIVHVFPLVFPLSSNYCYYVSLLVAQFPLFPHWFSFLFIDGSLCFPFNFHYVSSHFSFVYIVLLLFSMCGADDDSIGSSTGNSIGSSSGSIIGSSTGNSIGSSIGFVQ